MMVVCCGWTFQIFMKCIKIEYPVTQIKKNRKEDTNREDMPRRQAGQPDAAAADGRTECQEEEETKEQK
jgi:hypothetical protein